MSDQVKDPRVNAPACPEKTCGAPAGSLSCFTETGFPRGFHKARLVLIKTGSAPAKPAAGSMAKRRPNHKQADMLEAAIADENGQFEVSGYNFSGDAQRRGSMKAMSDPARGWFRYTHSTPHCEVYVITDAGRAAWQRYDDWMHGR